MSAPHSSAESDPRTPDLGPTGIYNPVDTASDLVRLLDQYLADLQAGRTPDKARLLADHPELAQQLEDCLAGIEFVHRAAKPAAGIPAQLGDFQIVREIGRGGMGVVYEAQQISLKRKVALKVLRFGVTADAEVMQRFQREAETVAHLHHTNIVPIHAVGCEQGVHYYAMQFIEGNSLAAKLDDSERTALANEGRVDFQQVAGWTLQAAEALAHAHQRGVIHRDIKPSNLILDPEGTVWLTDFGLAKRADEVTMTAAGVVMGTPRYMSPEQAAAAKQPIDHRTDIYSLGATFYELATGKPVFDSQTPQGVITQILNTEPVPPRVLQGKLPRDLETIILKCLAKEPAKRYQHARELADDLRSYLEGRPIRARRASLMERAARWARKHQRSTSVSIASVAVSLLVIAGGLIGWNAYQESLLGRLFLTTDGPSLVAEVLNDQDELVVPSFPVPHPQEVIVPAGSYRVRLSSSGMLSETWQIDVERGQRQSYPVKLIDRLLAAPLEIRDMDMPLLIELNGQAHLFHRGERGWRLTRGDTLTSAWQNDLQKYPEKPEDAPYPGTAVNGASHDILQTVANMSYGSETGNSPGLTQPAVDVNNDSRDDLILASRNTPSLVAVSGTDGKVLWWYRAPPNFPKEHDATLDPFDLKGSSEEAGVIGQPILVNINGEPTVVAMMVSLRSQLRTKAGKEFIKLRTYYVEAVAARTGKQVWRTTFALPELAETYLGDLIKLFPPKLEVTEFDGQRLLLLPVNTKVFGFDLQTGKEAWPARDLGGRPIQVPQFSDLDGDRRPEVLVVFLKPDSNYEEGVLKAISLQTGTALWERIFRPTDRLDSNEIRRLGSEVALVVDLDQDGKSEIVISTTDDWSSSGGGKHWYGLELLEGMTGAPRWQHRLWTSRYDFASGGVSNGSVRILVGPDLNGDRHLELFATSMCREIGGEKHFLQVDASSGKDGSVLWRREVAAGHSLAQRNSRMQWWQVSEDGWPQLVVPVDRESRTQPATFVFSASTGRMTGILPEVVEPQVADLNADGIPDLFHLAKSQGSRRLTVLKGLPPYDWRRPGDWKAGQDYDGDGVVDFLKFHYQGYQPSTLDVFSGRDFRILWQTEMQRVSAENSLLTSADVDGDGTCDVVALEVFDSPPHGNSNSIGAISGKDGKRLWRGHDFGTHMGSNSSSGGGAWSNYRYPFLDQRDLDADGRPEILVATNIGDLNTISLGAISNKDGSLLWKIPFLNGAYTGSSFIDRHIWHDLNGDGTLDIVLWVPQSIGEQGVAVGSEVRAFNGRDGKPLWKEAARITHTWFLWPRIAIGDLDGDGQAEVVLTTNDGKGWDQKTSGFGGFNCELVVLDGKNGQRKWNWPWVSGSLDLWPPLLVNMDGDEKRTICMGVVENSPTASASNIMMFDPQGKIRHKIPVGWVNSSQAWAALDVDGNGKEELLYVNDSQLLAYSGGDKRNLWTRPLSSYGFRFDEFRAERKGQPATLVAWADRTVFGLNPATGTPRWRCDVPAQDSFQLIAGVSESNSSADPPLVVSLGSTTGSTIVQHAWPTNPAGDYQPPQAEPITFAEYLDPGRFRHLPWIYRRIGLSEISVFLIFLGMLLYWTSQGKWRRVLLYLLLFCIITLGIGTLIIQYLASPLLPDEQYSWEGWYWILFIGGGILGALTMVAGGVVLVVKLIRRLLFGARNRRIV